MTMVITMRHRTKNMMMISQSMKITLTKMMMKTKITTMKTMMMKITMMKIMTMKTTMTMTTIIEEEAEEDQETETSRETAREDLLPEAVEAVLVEDQDVVLDQDQDHREEEEIQEVPEDQDQEEEADLQVHQTQTVITMITDMIIRAGQEEAGTEVEDLQDRDPAQIPVQADQDQVAAEAAQDQEIMAVQVEVPIQVLVTDHQEEVLLP